MSLPGYQRPLPQITTLNEQFWNATGKHELQLQRCKSCLEFQWYPRAMCIHCGSTDLEWTKTTGKGVVYSYTVIRQVVGNSSDFAKDIPFAIVLVELDEGPRMYAPFDGDFAGLEIGKRVQVTFQDVTEHIAIPKFRFLEDRNSISNIC